MPFTATPVSLPAVFVIVPLTATSGLDIVSPSKGDVIASVMVSEWEVENVLSSEDEGMPDAFFDVTLK